jgi:hypothetical protein
LPPGLYPGGRSTPDPAHAAVGARRAAQIEPLDAAGKPAPGGQMVLLSIGMSNTASEFERFIGEARRSPAVNRRLVIVNGALSSADAEMCSAPTINASAVSGRPPLDVEFRTGATWANRFYWSFGDGTSASSPQARKTFIVRAPTTSD